MKPERATHILSEKEIKKLSSQLSTLTVEHAKAMRDATFLGLTDQESAEMTRRRKRMNEICKQLGKVSLKQAPKMSLFAA
jgi:hypothetical protein